MGYCVHDPIPCLNPRIISIENMNERMERAERHMLFHAHSANAVGIWHPLFDHLTSVSSLAREFAATTPWADEARLSGLLHDLGKYGDLFQARLRGQASGLDHWSAGAQLALLQHRAVAACLVDANFLDTEAHFDFAWELRQTRMVSLPHGKMKRFRKGRQHEPI